MKEHIKKISDRLNTRNKAPLQDFDGFTPEDMYQIIYYPFSENSKIKIYNDCDFEILKQCPIFNIVIDLLSIMYKKQGIKLTPKGNIQRKVMHELYRKKHITDELAEAGFKSIRTEQDWAALSTIKIVLKFAGIVRQYKGKLLIVNSWKEKFETLKYSDIFFHFLKVFATEFNWEYNDGFEDEEIGQVGFLYLLYLVNRYGQDFKDLHFYTEKYFKAFPTLAFAGKAYNADNRYSDSERAILVRFFERFAEWFGFVEIAQNPEQNYFDREIKIKKTKFLCKILAPAN